MKISLNWVKQFTDIDISTKELVNLATERLGGVEAVVNYAGHYDGIVVAKVVSCEKHPNADKLSLCKIDDGGVVKDVARDQDGLVQVVCGAPNVKQDVVVAWIPPGSIVPASYGEKELFVLEARDLRGEASNGMLASPAELGMNDDHSGILEIEEDVKLGTPFKQLYDLDDTIIEIENKMFTHRPDGFGHLGVAREIAGIQHKAFKSPKWYLYPELPNEGQSRVEVSIEDFELCPRYMAVEFESVEIKPSPLWLQSYLKRVGMKPINNVVDITNYIMMLTAQPIHAFDFDKIATSLGHPEQSDNEIEGLNQVSQQAQGDKCVKIIVRTPQEGEKMTLLDGKEIMPHKDATLICNPDGPIALGGVMGGGNSEIDANTTHVVLECATFNMYNVRKTTMIHGLFTDAATRLTKGQPSEQLPSVLDKAIEMFKELTGARVVGGVTDAYPAQGSKIDNQEYIEIETKFINDRLGSKFSSEDIVKLLTNVEIEAHEASGPISVTPPFWRTDLEIPEDIVEEVGRLYGFNQLQIRLPKRSITPVTPNPLRTLKSEIRNVLSRAGANEVLTYSFVHGDLLKKANQDPERAYSLRNALSPDLQYYRLSLLPSLLDKVRPNIKAGVDEFVLFEIGKTHSKSPGDDPKNVPDEYTVLEVVYTSSKAKTGAAYFHMLRYVDNLLSELGIPYKIEKPDQIFIDDPKKRTQAEQPFDVLRSAYMFYKHAKQGGMIGVVGELEQSVIKSFKLPSYTAAAVFALDGASFESENRHLNSYKPLSKYPSTEQDITLKVAGELKFSELKTLVESELASTEYGWKLLPLGIYQKEGESTKNITFRITISHHDRTLTTHEVTELVEKISWVAHQKLQAEQV